MNSLRKLFQESRNYIQFATFLFIGGALLGFIFQQQFEPMVSQLLKELGKIKELLAVKDSALYTSWFIFQNNFKTALTMLLLGSIIFVLPMITLFLNGLLVGYVLKATALAGVSASKVFIVGILPHGILELPAILIAGGIGIFLGLNVFRWFFGRGKFFSILFSNERSDLQSYLEKGRETFKKRLKGIMYLIIVLFLTLLIAAFIEGYITPVTIQKFVAIPSK